MFSFVSCKDTNEISEYKNDRYIYGMVPMPEGYATIMKFDVVEKTAVPACPDPPLPHHSPPPPHGRQKRPSHHRGCLQVRCPEHEGGSGH